MPDAARPFDGEYDYVIAGAGSAGCVVAERLSRDPGTRVLLLEAGGRDNWIWFHIPVGYLFAIGNPIADQFFRPVVVGLQEHDCRRLDRFGVFGPPTIIFFGTDGLQRHGYEVVGYMKAEAFAQHVNKALADSSVTASK